MDAATRRAVRERAEGRCEYCRIPQAAVTFVQFHTEHIIPRQHGGGDERENLAFACQHCNSHKGPNLTGIDPQTAKIVHLFHPREQLWDDHFALEDEAIVGLTPDGRATVLVLNMNSESRLFVRAELITRGDYP